MKFQVLISHYTNAKGKVQGIEKRYSNVRVKDLNKEKQSDFARKCVNNKNLVQKHTN